MKILLLIPALFIGFYLRAQELKEHIEYYDYVSVNASGESKIKMISNVDKNGFVVGEAKHYLEDGTLKFIINHTSNISKEFYHSGELKKVGAFNPDTGEHLGEWITYNKKGKIIVKENFSN